MGVQPEFLEVSFSVLQATPRSSDPSRYLPTNLPTRLPDPCKPPLSHPTTPPSPPLAGQHLKQVAILSRAFGGRPESVRLLHSRWLHTGSPFRRPTAATDPSTRGSTTVLDAACETRPLNAQRSNRRTRPSSQMRRHNAARTAGQPTGVGVQLLTPTHKLPESKHPANSGRLGPCCRTLAKFDQRLTDVGQTWPSFAKSGKELANN